MRGLILCLVLALSACTSEPPVHMTDPFGAEPAGASDVLVKPTISPDVK